MNRQQFIDILKSPEMVSDSAFSELEQIIKDNPYFHSAYVIAANSSKLLKKKDAGKWMNTAAIYATNRNILKKYILGQVQFHGAVVSEIAGNQIQTKPQSTPSGVSQQKQQVQDSPEKSSLPKPPTNPKSPQDHLLVDLYNNLEGWKKNREAYLQAEKSFKDYEDVVDLEKQASDVEKIKNQIAQEVIAEEAQSSIEVPQQQETPTNQPKDKEDVNTSEPTSKEEVSDPQEVTPKETSEVSSSESNEVSDLPTTVSQEITLDNEEVHITQSTDGDNKKPSEVTEEHQSNDLPEISLEEIEKVSEISLDDQEEPEVSSTETETVKDIPIAEVTEEPKSQGIEVEDSAQEAELPEISDEALLEVVEFNPDKDDEEHKETEAVTAEPEVPTPSEESSERVPDNSEAEPLGVVIQEATEEAPQAVSSQDKEAASDASGVIEEVNPNVISTVIDEEIEQAPEPDNAEITAEINEELHHMEEEKATLKLTPRGSGRKFRLAFLRKPNKETKAASKARKKTKSIAASKKAQAAAEKDDAISKTKTPSKSTPTKAKATSTTKKAVAPKKTPAKKKAIKADSKDKEVEDTPKRTKAKPRKTPSTKVHISSLAAKANKKIDEKKANKATDSKEEPSEKDKKKKSKVTPSSTSSSKDKDSKKKGLKDQQNLIDNFLKAEPGISAPKDISENEEVVDLSRGSTNFPDDIVTENIAEILIKQKKIDKAIQAYKKLIKKHPSKKNYFQGRIDALTNKS